MLSTIAVGTDGSPTAEIAVGTAIDLAAATGARLLVLGAYSGKNTVAPSGGGEEHWLTNPADAVHLMLDGVCERARERGVDAAPFAADGDPADVLLRLAEHHEVDLLVIGNKGVDRRILASVPKSIVQHAPCDVYVVKTT